MIWSHIFGRRIPATNTAPDGGHWPIIDAGKLAPIARAAIPVDDERDASGRFVSEHRRKVREKCREQCAKLGRPVPEVLR